MDSLESPDSLTREGKTKIGRGHHWQDILAVIQEVAKYTYLDSAPLSVACPSASLVLWQ